MPQIGVARAERAAESDFALLLAAKAVAAQRRQDLRLRAAKPFADEIGRRLARGAIVHADISRAAAVGHVGDERDDRDPARNDTIDRRSDLGLVRGFEKEAMRSTRADPVDERCEIGEAHDLAEVIARAEDRRPQCRHLVFERNPHRLGEAIRRLHDDIHDELAPREAGLLALPAQFADRLLDALGGMPAHAAPRIEHAIDGRLAQARLERDFLDEKRMSHGRRLDGFLMGRRNSLAGLALILRPRNDCTEEQLMKDDNAKRLRANRVWLTADSCDLEEFKGQVERSLNRADYPFASDVVSNVLVYDGLEARKAAASPESRKELLAEWVDAFTDGPGIIVIRNAFPDHAAIDKSNAHYWAIIEEERASNVGGGDHFAKPGANDRIWNALEKLCLRDPAVFAAYYGNAVIALVSEAWLGPAYQITSQLNVVNPGGAAQVAHRDYHLGFQSAEAIERFPVHVQRLSPVLTLQGAIAHCDMPLETGPTLYLPFSQSYLPGYMATARPEFRDYFDKHHVQLPLAKGDAVFFNPALFHAAGTNRSKDVRRIANLLQVSSAFGRAMESVDRLKMSLKLYPALKDLLADQAITAAEADNAIAA